MRHHFRFLPLVLALLLVLAGCAAPAEDTAADQVGLLEVLGTPYSADALRAMEQVTVNTEGTDYVGIRLLDLIAGQGLQAISMVASDGYSAVVNVADLDDTCLLAWSGDDQLDAVLPDQNHAGWVRGVVAIEAAEAEGEAAAVPAGPTATPNPDAIFVANGVSFTMADLQAMDQLTVDCEGTSYTGVRLLDVLDRAGISSGTIGLAASDGYSGQVDLDVLDDQSLLAYNDQGGVNTLICGYDKGAWVKYVISIDLLGGEKPAGGPTPTARAITGATITVVDSTDREVTIPADVERVVSLRAGITEIICALGECDKIVAVDEMTKDGTSYGEFIAGLHPELMQASAPYAGSDVSTEEILRLNPDVVLHGGYGRIKQAEALMKQAPGLPVVIAHFETIEEYMDDIRIVATCVDAESRGEELIAYLQGFLDNLAARLEGIPESERVRVFYGGHEIDHGYTPDTFEHSQIVLAGGTNVMAELSGWMPEVSAEQLLVWDPQVIVVLNGADVPGILANAQVASVSAIRDGRVYTLPEAGWDFSSPRAIFAIEWLASKLYPERFADLDIEAEADAFYQAVFGVDYTGPSLAD